MPTWMPPSRWPADSVVTMEATPPEAFLLAKRMNMSGQGERRGREEDENKEI